MVRIPEAEVFGVRLKELREQRGETVRSLAEAVETSFTYISDLEHGRKVPSLSMLLRLAAALDCKVTELVKVFNSHDLRTLVKKRR
jgi:transcriptional regulator with XRE-family HTH domain